MTRLFFLVVFVLATSICVLSFMYGDGWSAWFCLAMMTIYVLDHGYSNLWHYQIEVWFVRVRLQLIDHAIGNSRAEIEYFEKASRHSDAFAENEMLRLMLADRQKLVRRIRELDAKLETWR